MRQDAETTRSNPLHSALMALSGLTVLVLVWLLVRAGMAAWDAAGLVQATDGTPAWPLRSMLLAFATFTTILTGYGAYRAFGRRNKG